MLMTYRRLGVELEVLAPGPFRRPRRGARSVGSQAGGSRGSIDDSPRMISWVVLSLIGGILIGSLHFHACPRVPAQRWCDEWHHWRCCSYIAADDIHNEQAEVRR